MWHSLSVLDVTVVRSDLSVSDFVKFGSSLSVEGSSKFRGSLSAGNTVRLGSGVVVNSGVFSDSLSISGLAEFSSDISVAGKSRLGGSVSVLAGLYAFDSFSVAGVMKLADALVGHSTATLSSTLSDGGISNFRSNMRQ